METNKYSNKCTFVKIICLLLTISIIALQSIISIKANAQSISGDSGNESVKVIAHRGYSGIAPENTMTAFKKAIDIGADMIELDVQLTKDNVIVVFHDGNMKRVTGVSGFVSDYTYEELCTFNAGKWFCDSAGTVVSNKALLPNFAYEYIPTLTEVLELVSKSKLGIYLEFKDLTEQPALTDEQKYMFVPSVVAEVERFGMHDRVVYACFNYEYLKQIKLVDSSIPILCNTSLSDADVLLSQYPAEYYGLRMENVGFDTIEKLHAGGSKAYVWTVNTAPQMRNMIALGADGIVTNYVGLGLEVVSEYK